MTSARFGAMRSRALKRNENIIADRILRRRGDNPELSYGISSQLASDAAEIASIKQIGFPILAKGQHQAWAACAIRIIKRKRIAASEIFIFCVENFPIRWRKIVLVALTAQQIWSNPKHSFPVAPGARPECISR